MVSKNGYVRWVSLVALLCALVASVIGASAFLVAQHSNVETHSGAVKKDQFIEFAKRIDERLDVISSDIKEIRKEIHKQRR